MKRPRVLLIEDDLQLCEKISDILKQEYAIEFTKNILEAKKLISKKVFDLYIIDIMLYDRSNLTGLDICKHIRKKDKSTPILIISGKTAINFKLGAFNYEADDYLCKPFNILELRARIKALLRRNNSCNHILRAADLHLNRKTHKVTRGNLEIELRKKEFQILEQMLLNKGNIITRDNIVNNMWHNNGDVESNTIDVHIKNLRAKIDKPFKKKLIKTVYGLGYKVDDELK